MSEFDDRAPKRARVVVNGNLDAQVQQVDLIPQTDNQNPPGSNTGQGTIWFATQNSVTLSDQPSFMGLVQFTGDNSVDRGEFLMMRDNGRMDLGPPRDTEPASSKAGSIYFDDGTNSNSGLPALLFQEALLYREIPTYEESTWAITVGDGTTDFTLSSSNSGFVIFQNIVVFQFHFRLALGGKGAAVPGANVQISLPFTSASGAGERAGAALADMQFLTFAGQVGLRIAASATFALVRDNVTGAAGANITVAGFDDGVVPGVGRTRMSGSGVYRKLFP